MAKDTENLTMVDLKRFTYYYTHNNGEIYCYYKNMIFFHHVLSQYSNNSMKTIIDRKNMYSEKF